MDTHKSNKNNNAKSKISTLILTLLIVCSFLTALPINSSEASSINIATNALNNTPNMVTAVSSTGFSSAYFVATNTAKLTSASFYIVLAGSQIPEGVNIVCKIYTPTVLGTGYAPDTLLATSEPVIDSNIPLFQGVSVVPTATTFTFNNGVMMQSGSGYCITLEAAGATFSSGGAQVYASRSSAQGIAVYTLSTNLWTYSPSTYRAAFELFGEVFSVVYGAGGASGSVPVDPYSPYAPGSTVTVLSPTNLNKPGYNFNGWANVSGSVQTMVSYDIDTAGYSISGGAVDRGVGNSFLSGTSFVLTEAQFMMYRSSNNGLNNEVVAQLYSLNGVFGSGSETLGDLLAQSEPVIWGNVGTSSSMVSFYFTTEQYLIEANTGYFIMWMMINNNPEQASSSVRYAMASSYDPRPRGVFSSSMGITYNSEVYVTNIIGHVADVNLLQPGNTFTITSDTFLVAQWSTAQYSVAYVANFPIGASGSGSAPVDANSPYYYQSSVTVLGLGSLSVPNYSFIGWSANASSSVPTHEPGDVFTITGNTVFYAVWLEDDKFAVVYDGNGNTGGTAPLDPYSPYYGGMSVNVLGQGSLVKQHYTFAGWSANASSSVPTHEPGDVFTITGNTVFYAVWQPIMHTVTYNTGGASGSAPVDANSPYFEGSLATVLPPTGLSVPNHVFGGWQLTETIGGVQSVVGVLNPGDSFTVNGPSVLTALWLTQYTVTYNGNGASGSPPTDPNNPYTIGSSVTVLGPASLTMSHYTFIGWSANTTSNTPTHQPNSVFTITGDTVFYAVWAMNTYTVTFAPGSQGTFTAQVTTDLYAGAATPSPPAVTGNEGYIFTGWYPTVAATVTQTVTYTAQWEALPTFTVTFKNADGTTLKTQTVHKGGSATPPANPTMNGYTFIGWDKPYTNIQADTTITAKFEPYPPEPTPYYPPNKPTTFYFRSDQKQFNSTTIAYALETSNTNKMEKQTDTVYSSISYGFRIYILHSTGAISELTSGQPVAVVTRTTVGAGIQTATWECPTTQLEIGDRLVITIFAQHDNTGMWNQKTTYMTNELLSKQINPSIWEFDIYTDLSGSPGFYSAAFMWGSRNYQTAVGQISLKEALPQEVTIWKGAQGDIVGAALYPYMFWAGNLMYGLALLFFAGTMYLRYRHFGPALILTIIFGGAGALGFLIPSVAFRLFYFVIIFVVAVVLWRLFK